MAVEIWPCIWRDDDADAAAAFYEAALGASIVARSQYPTGVTLPDGRRPTGTCTIDFGVGGQRITLLNGGPGFRPNPAISFFLYAAEPVQVDAWAEALAAGGGKFLLPLGAYDWSERYAWVEDRFGVSWQLMHAPDDPEPGRAVPALMFANQRFGNARDAISHYTARLGGELGLAMDGPEGTLMHARFTLAGQPFVAMDAPGEHDFDFSWGVSLQAICEEQADVDRLWDAMIEGGGKHSRCGWLHDPFGVAWQVIPRDFLRVMQGNDPERWRSVFEAMLGMTKLSVPGRTS